MLEVNEVTANVQAGTLFVHTLNLSVPFVAVEIADGDVMAMPPMPRAAKSDVAMWGLPGQ